MRRKFYQRIADHERTLRKDVDDAGKSKIRLKIIDLFNKKNICFLENNFELAENYKVQIQNELKKLNNKDYSDYDNLTYFDYFNLLKKNNIRTILEIEELGKLDVAKWNITKLRDYIDFKNQQIQKNNVRK